jgi:hypothetical protein
MADSDHKARLWSCPNCGRKFVKLNQAHSCQRFTTDDHFHGKNPQLRRIYNVLLTKLSKFGPLRVDAVKSSINLISKYHFGGIKVYKNHLRLGFLSNETIIDARIQSVEKLGPRKAGYHVKLSSPREVNDQLMAWLEKAYHLQS